MTPTERLGSPKQDQNFSSYIPELMQANIAGQVPRERCLTIKELSMEDAISSGGAFSQKKSVTAQDFVIDNRCEKALSLKQRGLLRANKKRSMTQILLN